MAALLAIEVSDPGKKTPFFKLEFFEQTTAWHIALQHDRKEILDLQ